VAYLGLRVAAPTSLLEVIDDDVLNTRACNIAEFTPPSHGWVTKFGAWCGRQSGIVTRYDALYTTNTDGSPGERLGYTRSASISGDMLTAAGGTNVEAAVYLTSRVFSPSNLAIRVEGGRLYRYGMRSHGGNIGIAVHSGTGADTTHWRRQIASGYPADPFGHTSTGQHGKLAVYVVWTENSAPSAPGSLLPVSGSSLNTTTPTFEGTFADADITPHGDQLREYQLELRQLGQTTLLWQSTYTAISTEITAKKFTRPYGGSALTAGTSYEWRARVADATLTYGAWTAWTGFAINAAGVATPTTPTGEIASGAGINWVASWTHPSATSTDRVQVRVLQGATVVKLGAEVTKTVLNAAAFTVTAAEAGIGTLVAGTSYTWQIRGRATPAGLWSPWSAAMAFYVNAAPNTPTDLQPPSGAASTARPLLEFLSLDIDDDVAILTAELRLKANDGSVLFTRVPAYNATRGAWEYQTTSADYASFGTFKWDARVYDGTTYSAYSAEQTFVYASGPAVAYVFPTANQVLATSTPAITWTAITGQTKSRVTVYTANNTLAVYDSGTVTSAATDHTLPAGRLKNGIAYDVVVCLTDTNNVTGCGLRQPFSVSYPVTDLLTNVTASAVRAPGDVDLANTLLSWGITTYAPGAFAGYVIRRWPTGLPEDATAPLRTLTGVSQTTWTDFHAPPGVDLTYGVSQLIRIGADTAESAMVEASVTLVLTTVIVASVADPHGKRAVLRWSPGSRGGTIDANASTYETWGSGGKPEVVYGPGGKRVVDASFTVITDEYQSARGHLEAIEGLARAATTDLASGTVSYRDERERLFGWISSFSYARRETRGWTVKLRVEETNYIEGAGE